VAAVAAITVIRGLGPLRAAVHDERAFVWTSLSNRRANPPSQIIILFLLTLIPCL
jgi:hypothetical protein